MSTGRRMSGWGRCGVSRWRDLRDEKSLPLINADERRQEGVRGGRRYPPRMSRSNVLVIVGTIAPLFSGLIDSCRAAPPELAALDSLYPALDRLYIDLHQHPELSLHEE